MANIYDYLTNDLPSYFTGDKGKGFLTADELKNRRAMALALASRARPYPKTIGEGLTALGEGLYERQLNQDLTRQESVQRERDAGAFSGMPTSLDVSPARVPAAAEPQPATAPAPAQPAPSNQPAVAPRRQAETPLANGIQAMPTIMAQASTQPQQAMSTDEATQRLRRATTGTTTGDPYKALGQVNNSGDRGYGAYEIMASRIPALTAQHAGREMTPDEFLNDPKAQDAVAAAQFAGYQKQFGDDNKAAAAFYGGPNYEKDQRPEFQARVADFQKRFNEPLADRTQLAGSLANQGNSPLPASDGASAAAASQQPRVRLAAIPDATVSDAPSPSTPGRADIASAAAQQQMPQPQRVAQAPALPQPAPSPTQQITKAPQPGMEEQPTPAGPRPTLQSVLPPQALQMMDRLRQIEASPYYSKEIREEARRRYDIMERRANDELVRQDALWSQRNAAEEKFRIDTENRLFQRQKNPLEIQKIEKELGKRETHVVEGRVLEKQDDGSYKDVTPGGNLPPLTEAQGKDLRFYQRGKWALHNLGEGKELTDFYAWYASGMPAVGNYAVNAKFQRQLQAAKELAAVQLRLETGAAAPPAELQDVIQRYIPRPGDTPEVLLQKEQGRNTLVKGYADGMGSKGQAHIEKFDREFEVDKKVFDRKMDEVTIQNAPPVRISDPAQLKDLKSGQRFIAPDGSVKRKP